MEKDFPEPGEEQAEKKEARGQGRHNASAHPLPTHICQGRTAEVGNLTLTAGTSDNKATSPSLTRDLPFDSLRHPAGASLTDGFVQI